MVKGVSAFADDVRERALPRARPRLHDGAGRGGAAARTCSPSDRRAVHRRLRLSGRAPASSASPPRATATSSTSPRASARWSRRPASTTAWCRSSCRARPRRSRPWSTSRAASTTCAPRSTASCPREGDYEHNRLNADTNSHAHITAAIVGPSETVPVRDGRLELGTWQQLVLVDFDDRPRRTRRAGPRPGLNLSLSRPSRVSVPRQLELWRSYEAASAVVPSPAMVVALIALFLALGGSAYALVITGKTIKNNTVTGQDIRNGTLRGKDVHANGLGGSAIKERASAPCRPRASPTAAPASPWSPPTACSRAAAASARWPAPATGRYQVIFTGDVRGCAVLRHGRRHERLAARRPARRSPRLAGRRT